MPTCDQKLSFPHLRPVMACNKTLNWKIRGFSQGTLGESAYNPQIFSVSILGAYHLMCFHHSKKCSAIPWTHSCSYAGSIEKEVILALNSFIHSAISRLVIDGSVWVSLVMHANRAWKSSDSSDSFTFAGCLLFFGVLGIIDYCDRD